jgi:hypothetical protein
MAGGPPPPLRRGGRWLRRRLLQIRNNLGRIKAEDFPKLHEFHDIDAPVAAFEPGDEGLIFAQAGRKLGLGHFQGIASGDQEVDQRLVPFRSKRLWQFQPHRVDGGDWK